MVGWSETFEKEQKLYWKPMSTVDWRTVALEKEGKEEEEKEEEQNKNKKKKINKKTKKKSNEVSRPPGCYAVSTGKYLNNRPS